MTQRTNWTREQYDEWLRRPSTSAAATLVCPREQNLLARRIAKSEARQKNRTEAEFELRLKADFPQCDFLYEQVKLQLAEKCWFLPDFFCPQLLTFYEVKGGHIYDDSMVKFKTARRIHPWATFIMWQKKAGVWKRLY